MRRETKMARKSYAERKRDEYLAAIERDPERKKKFDALIKEVDAYIQKHYRPDENTPKEEGCMS